MKIFILIITILINLYGYTDLDFDGVDDAIDKCPNTSFEDEVGEDGCPYNKHYRGKATILLSQKIAYSRSDLQTNSLNLYMSYRYNNLAFSLSHSYYKIFDSRYNNLNLSGDYYLSSNYSIKNDKLNINYSLGLKIPNRSSDISTKEFDYFGFLNLNYNLNKKQNIYASYGYTLTGKSDSKNYSSLSIGSDYMLSDDWQISLTYNYNGSTYDNINNYRSISIGNYYKLSDKLFMKFRYDRGLDDNSYKNAFSLSLGAVFE